MKLLLALVLLLTACDAQVSTPERIEVFFSPRGGCTAAIIKQIDEARFQIRMQTYSFTSAPIMKAVLNAHRRNVDVQVLIDEDQKTQRYSAITFLTNNHIPVFLDGSHAIAHNKIIIIDAHTVITGSFNFSKAAEESNAENVLVIRDSEVVKRYLENWDKHRGHSKAP